MQFNNLYVNIRKEVELDLSLKNDIVFKAFFAKKGNEKYLKSFLEALLKEKIDKIEIMRRSNITTNEKNRKIRKNRFKSNNKSKQSSRYRNATKVNQKL